MSKDLFESDQRRKVEEAHERMQVHVAKHESFEEFVLYFESITNGKSEAQVKQWLLLVLHSHLKPTGFEALLDLVSLEKRASLNQWLEDSLKLAKNGS